GEQGAEGRVVEQRQFAERGGARDLSGGEPGFAPLLRKLVPRTHRKAVVAAVDAVADQRAQFARDRTFVLDGEIGDAAPRIEPVRRRKRRGRADVEAGAAAAA